MLNLLPTSIGCDKLQIYCDKQQICILIFITRIKEIVGTQLLLTLRAKFYSLKCHIMCMQASALPSNQLGTAPATALPVPAVPLPQLLY